MACSCAEGWSTTILAAKKGYRWKAVSLEDGARISSFLDAGGCGMQSINKFAKESLMNYAHQRYANSSLLLDESDTIVGFVSNAVGSIEMTPDELVQRNMDTISSVPVVFLHRLGVHVSHQNKGIGRLLGWRVFETLSHSCVHTAAAAVALQVDPDNVFAKKLYSSLGFARIEFESKTGKEMHVIPYDDAISRIPAC